MQAIDRKTDLKVLRDPSKSVLEIYKRTQTWLSENCRLDFDDDVN
jgi:hypothetical protein